MANLPESGYFFPRLLREMPGGILDVEEAAGDNKSLYEYYEYFPFSASYIKILLRLKRNLLEFNLTRT
jgi:hypothetical protein